jgi:DNA-binding NarL/FixJ family response regulator
VLQDPAAVGGLCVGELFVQTLTAGLALGDAGVDMVGTAGTPNELQELVRRLLSDVAIVHIEMPPTHTEEGLVAAQSIRATYPSVAVLVLSQYLESAYAARLLESHPESVGYLLRDRVSDVAVPVDALRRVHDGASVLDLETTTPWTAEWLRARVIEEDCRAAYRAIADEVEPELPADPERVYERSTS